MTHKKTEALEMLSNVLQVQVEQYEVWHGKRVKMPPKLNADILQKVKNAKYSQYLKVKVEYV